MAEIIVAYADCPKPWWMKPWWVIVLHWVFGDVPALRVRKHVRIMNARRAAMKEAQRQRELDVQWFDHCVNELGVDGQ